MGVENAIETQPDLMLDRGACVRSKVFGQSLTIEHHADGGLLPPVMVATFQRAAWERLVAGIGEPAAGSAGLGVPVLAGRPGLLSPPCACRSVP